MSILAETFTDELRYQRLRGRLVHYLKYRRCYEAEELADEAIFRLDMVANRENSTANLEARAFGIVRLVHLEWLRKEKLRRVAAAEYYRNTPGSAAEPVMLSALEDVLARLPSGNAELLLRHYSGRDWKDLAKEIGISAEALRVRMKRLRDNVALVCRQSVAREAA